MLTYYQHRPVIIISDHNHKKIWRYQSITQESKLHLKNLTESNDFKLLSIGIKGRCLYFHRNDKLQIEVDNQPDMIQIGIIITKSNFTVIIAVLYYDITYFVDYIRWAGCTLFFGRAHRQFSGCSCAAVKITTTSKQTINRRLAMVFQGVWTRFSVLTHANTL